MNIGDIEIIETAQDLCNSLSSGSTLRSISIESIFTKQGKRKCLVGGCGCAFIVTGILILIFFIGFIENDYKNKCFYDINFNNNNSNFDSRYENEWFELHPELKYFNMNCRYQVVNLFNDYPCNCRYYIRHPNNEIDGVQFSPSLRELTFVKFDDLQNIYINGYLDTEYFFTKEMLSGMKYLQIWTMTLTGIGNIWSQEGTSKLQNLEIFQWYGTQNEMGFNTTIPFKAFAKLDKMKAISILNSPYIANTEIPDDICNLKEMRYFSMGFAPYVESIPCDCIAENWKQLRFLQFETWPQITYIPPDIWKLPNLQTVVLPDNGFTQEYRGFGYLSNDGNISGIDNSLVEFIEKFDPCAFTCSTSMVGCTAPVWQNGVCSHGCNREECNYDGGDCNQLCDCDYDLWCNDKCDLECNTTECNWDFYQCVEIDGVNETCNAINDNDTTSIGGFSNYKLYIFEQYQQY